MDSGSQVVLGDGRKAKHVLQPRSQRRARRFLLSLEMIQDHSGDVICDVLATLTRKALIDLFNIIKLSANDVISNHALRHALCVEFI